MGNKAVRAGGTLKRKEIRDFVALSHFNEEEVALLYEHFKTISSTEADDGVIDRREFRTALGFKDGVYLDRMFRVFDENDDGFVNFAEFLQALSILCARSLADEKIQFSFRMYDMDRDGSISKVELMEMLRTSTEETGLVFTEDQMRELVDLTFEQLSPASPDGINMDEYARWIRAHPAMLEDMTVDVHARIAEEKKRYLRTHGGREGK